ncbi:MAG: RloB domain-containing protein [Lachnospiraceae bacterium]|nr:RloB domain-containing protein [Lachnospiraceae bacterium]
MAKKDRTGNRKFREQRKQYKVPELGYYLVVTDTEATERCFFNGLHQALPNDVRNKLVIKVVETKTRTMIDKCLELTAYDAQYRIPWIVFDRDQVQGFDEIIKEAEEKGIQVGWSNPCFEIWMYAYFGSMPAIQDSWTCCSEFGRVYETKTGQKYSKADEQMYGKICKAGDEEKAIRIAHKKLEQCIREGKTKPSDMCPCTTVHKFVGEIKAKRKAYEETGIV